MLQWLAGKTDSNYAPAAFLLHFGPQLKNGSAAAKRHLEFFRHTDMDFVGWDWWAVRSFCWPLTHTR
jgi:hypothetical protein